MTSAAGVPFLDLRAAYQELSTELDAAARRVLASGNYIGGTEVERFEAEYARSVGAEHCIGCGNGLDALSLTLRAAGLGPGDEIIVPSHTFIATWLAVSAVGARIVPVDPDEVTCNLQAEGVRRAITGATRAIVVVHLYGRPAPLDALRALASEHGLLLIEDAAQAHGAQWRRVPIGTHGDATTWSFYPAKNLGALGDAGAVTTRDARLAGRLRLIRQYGSERKYHHELMGVNSRLDPLQAALLAVKLPYLKQWNDRRRVIAARYRAALADLDGLSLPPDDDDAASSWHLFVVRSRARDDLQRALSRAGVTTVIHYPTPPHRQPAYAADFASRHLPVAERLASQVLSLPIGPHQTEEQTCSVIDAVRRACRP